MEKPTAIHVVYAEWCPHCVPTTVAPMKKRASELGIPCVLHDIDTEDVKVADDLVKKYGDWSPDYLIPQVFLEYADGEYRHVLTGNPQGVALTRAAVERLVSSDQLAGSK
jgi:thiol-disulfide isomerase/thioredoxin